MYRLRLFALLTLVLLAACRATEPDEAALTPTALAWRPLSTVTPTTVGQAAVTPLASAAPSAAVLPEPPSPTPPTLLPSPTLLATPTITLTPQPTNTALPTNTPPPAAAVTIERPLPDEFVAAIITAAGTVANAPSGGMQLSIRTLDGAVIGPPAIYADMKPSGDGYRFLGQVALDTPPTPRQVVLIARYEPDDPAWSVVEAGQAINVQGRYGHVDRLVVEQPKPLQRPDTPEIEIRGVASGPPAKVLVRLLDAGDNVLTQTEAQLSWYQPGLPCDYSALLPNIPEATQLLVITLGTDDAVLESTRVRLSQ